MSHRYLYTDGQLKKMYAETDEAYVEYTFYYDASGNPLAASYFVDYWSADVLTEYMGTFYYVTNAQGDVVALVDETGELLVIYSYDAWGKPIHTEYYDVLTGYGYVEASQFVSQNPFRYRGYVYDTETGLYYLQSRYYDPEVGRFINGDAFAATGQGLTGNNQFAYCGNNPVSRSDTCGHFWDTLFDVVSIVVSVIEVCQNPDDPWAWVGLAGDVVDLIPFVTGVGEVVRGIKTVDNVVDAADNVIDASRAIDKAGDAADVAKIATTGSPNTIGKIGEQLAGIDPHAKQAIKVNGRTRIPDALTETTLTEVKNVKYLSNTSQLKDFATYANNTGRKKVLYVRPTTYVTQSVREAGWEIKSLW